ncbi:unnamed protein product [Thlaspi arvense]|uniref:TPX2 C-terminal domain-containing protein n=1 Tax=Thlaspi arvense TaxID=13288 RepID=A0AAU9S5S4_THLAR|nr:unnamed protein product [Thlaspi arvense]
MDSTNLKIAKNETLLMNPIRFESRAQENSRSSENSNPNISHATPARVSGSVPAKSTKTGKSAQKNPKSKHNPSQAVFSPRNRIRERRFVVVKKKLRKEEKDSASVISEVDCKCGAKTNANMKKCVCIAYETLRASQEEFFNNRRESEVETGEPSQIVEEGDEAGVGESDETGRELKWWPEEQKKCMCSLDSSASMGSRRLKKKQIKVTSPKPFKLRTEERGRMKEEEFAKKLHEMTMEEEKMRIPIAQGLPWTTDEPEGLVKPHVKEITIPVDLKLHSDIRAVERAEFDYQIAEKINLIEQYKAERERLQKLAEGEELRRLRKEMIPKAQPMPYFDRPFIPKRSNKHPTIPRDPKFNRPQRKKIRCCSTSSWSESGSYMSDLLYQQDL